MLLRLLLLFTIVPLVELALLLKIGELAGWQFALLLVVVTGVVGAWLARQEGLRCLRRIQQQMAAGQLPGDPLMDGLMVLLAGVLLVTPGVLTDLLGFALLLTIFRRIVKRYLKSRFQARIDVSSPPGGWPRPNDQPPRHDKIIDVRVIDLPPEEPEEKN